MPGQRTPARSKAQKRDRLTPPLMHVFRDAHQARDARKPVDLRDADGERVIAGRRGLARQPVSESVLRREVALNLANLLNTTNLGSSEDLESFTHVRTSILNYGIHDLSRLSVDEGRVSEIAEELRGAVLAFEPRLLPQSFEAARDMSARANDLEVRFTIRADLRCDPLNVPVEFVAEVECDSAKIKIERL